MTWQEIINFALWICWGISASQYPNAETNLNIAYHNVKRAIIDIREDFFWDILTVSATVVWQSEYRIPTISTGNFNKVTKIMWASIKYSSSENFRKLEKRHQYQLEQDLSYYESSQWQSNPFFFVADDSIFIYPAPTVAVSSGLIIYGIKNLIDIDADTTSADMFWWKIDPEFHYVVAFYMAYLYWLNRWVDYKNDASYALSLYDIELNKMINYLKLRNDWIIIKKKP